MLSHSHFVGVEIFPVFWQNCTRLLRFLSVAFMLHYIKKSYISGQSAKLYLYSAHEKPVKYAKEVEAILKRISVKFQQQEQTYRSLHAAARSLLSSKGRVFLLFCCFIRC